MLVSVEKLCEDIAEGTFSERYRLGDYFLLTTGYGGFANFYMQVADVKYGCATFVSANVSDAYVTMYDRGISAALDKIYYSLPDLFIERFVPVNGCGVWIPTLDDVTGDERLRIFGGDNRTRARRGFCKKKNEMWWLDTLCEEDFTYYVIDSNGGVISGVIGDYEAKLVPAFRVRL